MRWSVFAIAAFVVVVAQLSLRDTLILHSAGEIRPDFIACLAVFIALFAERSAALWACWILGLLMDLAPKPGDMQWQPCATSALGAKPESRNVSAT